MRLFRSDDKFSQMLTQLDSQPKYGGGSGSGGCGDDEPGDDEDGNEDEEDEDDSSRATSCPGKPSALTLNFLTELCGPDDVSREGIPFELFRLMYPGRHVARDKYPRRQVAEDFSELSLGKMVTVVVSLDFVGLAHYLSPQQSWLLTISRIQRVTVVRCGHVIPSMTYAFFTNAIWNLDVVINRTHEVTVVTMAVMIVPLHFRELPLHYPSWRQMPPERKARVVTKIGTQFDLRPHMKSGRWLQIYAGIQQHMQKIYNGKKAALKERYWVSEEDGSYDLERIKRGRPSHISKAD
uniref:Uncharacterized protein n=1 Tax=Tanacetum cinerariifolium TaxID=118510 RepID=A0A699KB82_TANCI|nr:hypothetical protein [Tanacetum cinerariifolium]